MKPRLIIASACLTTLSISCGSAFRKFSGTTEKNLIKQASIEHACPVDSIRVIDRQLRLGTATYALDVCGKRRTYKQVANMFVETGKN